MTLQGATAMSPLGPVVEAQLEKSARLVSLFANGKRLEILYMLVAGDRSVGDLVTGTGGSISAISQQLKLLTLGGLIERRRNGRNIYYSLKGPDAGKVLESILGFCMDYTRQHPESARQVLAEGAEKDPQEPFTAR